MSSNSKSEGMVLIWCESLGISYKIDNKKVAAIKETDLRILRGEYVAVSGLFGPARNSFLNVIGCLEKPEEGKYIFDYSDVSLLNHSELVETRKGRIGFVFPNYNLFEDYSIRYNVEFPLNYMNLNQQDKNRLIERSLERVGFIGDMETRIDSLTELQKHKVSLARAIIHDPLLLIICEPAHDISRKESVEFLGILDSLNSDGISILLISEREHITLNARRSIVFEEGLVVSDECTTEAGFGKEVCAACRE